MGKLDGMKVFEGLFTMTNEFSEIRLQLFVPSTSLDYIRQSITNMRKSLDNFGHHSPQVLFTDKASADKSFFQEVFPTLGEGIQARPLHPYQHYPELELPEQSQHPQVYSTMASIDSALTPLLEYGQEVHISGDDTDIAVGFDAEWTFNRNRPAWHPVATVQVAHPRFGVLILRLTSLTTIPQALLSLLARGDIAKVGRSIAGDISRLQTSYPDQLLTVRNTVELSTFCKDRGLVPTGAKTDLASLCGTVLKRYLGKESSIRESDWSIDELSEDQKKYAALDAWASLKVYEAALPLSLVKEGLQNRTPGKLVTLLSDDQSTCIAYGSLEESQPEYV